MRRIGPKNPKKVGAGRLIAGILLGSLVGAAIGWLAAPGAETWRKLRGEAVDVRERIKTADDNVESQVRELAHDLTQPDASR
jgi:gas vesicle protein